MSRLSVLALSAAAILLVASAQLTPQNAQALKQLARSQLSQSLKGTSHADLEKVVQATHSLELLGDKPSSEEVCRAILQNKRELFERMTVSHTYNLGEIYRNFKCEALSELPTQVKSIFSNELPKMTKPSNLYYAHLLAKHGDAFGLSASDKTLEQRVKEHLAGAFNSADFSIGTPGLSGDSLKTLEMFAKHPSKETDKFVSAFLSKIQSQGVSAGDKYSFYSNSVDGVALNTHYLRIASQDGLSKD